MKTSKKRCWFVCSYFNPCNYYSRFLNFIEFINSIKEQNINLLVVEAYSVKSKYRIDKLWPDTLSINTSDTYWMKENLLNMGVTQLLKNNEIQYIGWLDCDIVVRDKFETNVLTSLETNKIVQVFSDCKKLDTGDSYQWKSSTCMLGLKNNNILSLLLNRVGEVGYGYAYHSDVLHKSLLYDLAIVGTGDWLNLLGCIPLKNPHSLCGDRFFKGTTKAFFTSYINWHTKMCRCVNSSIGYADNKITILNHGKDINRRYVHREGIIKKHKFDITDDIDITRRPYKLLNKKLESSILNYFISRDEDFGITPKNKLNGVKYIETCKFKDSSGKLLGIKTPTDYLNNRKHIYHTSVKKSKTNNETPVNITTINSDVVSTDLVISRHTDNFTLEIDLDNINTVSVRKLGSLNKHEVVVLQHPRSPAHSYIWYIIKNYNSLADITIFTNDINNDSVGRTNWINGIVKKQKINGGFIHNQHDRKSVNYDIEKTTNLYDLGVEKSSTTINTHTFAVSNSAIRKHPVNFYKKINNMFSLHTDVELDSFLRTMWESIFR